ncbi:hypothetical protein MPNT_340014 [Candidatus Methylacidithermus pantelleriae]|uniref:Uncharacterized protein n=2 Tax=Candidatus Methylacidithermus pantelleriae TaxID=2744239 RepID=A0A8J2FRN5_9BACT|nr:hypothetical protein MPNT_340014 [Candidatus Methylacidithermus pantelleriae]
MERFKGGELADEIHGFPTLLLPFPSYSAERARRKPRHPGLYDEGNSTKAI